LQLFFYCSGRKMKPFRTLGYASTVTLLALSALGGCSSSSPASGSGSGSGSSTGSGSSGTQAPSGTSGAAGQTSGNSSGASGATTGATSGSTGASGASGQASGQNADAATAGSSAGSTVDAASETATMEAAPVEEPEVLPTVAMVKAMCGMFTGSTAMTAPEFCVLFMSACNPDVMQPAIETLKAESTCESDAYPGWSTAKKNCVSEYVCKAAMGNAGGNCNEAQGFGNVCPMM
jgi:hypothetical protein